MACGQAFRIERRDGGVTLTQAELGEAGTVEAIEMRLAELDELLEEGEAEVEALRSREASRPLALGCSFFGLFVAVLLVIVLFMLLGRDRFGGWLFYLSIAAVVLAGLVRIRKKLPRRSDLEELRIRRTRAEGALASLRHDRDRLAQFHSTLTADTQTSHSNPETSNGA
jgi:hypothetical protein